MERLADGASSAAERQTCVGGGSRDFELPRPVVLLLGLLGLPLLLQRLLSRLLLHALLRVLVLVRHALTSLWVRVAPQLRRGSAGRIVALPSSSTSTT